MDCVRYSYEISVRLLYTSKPRQCHGFTSEMIRSSPVKGRGASSNPDSRFLLYQTELFDDGWNSLEEFLQTELQVNPKTELYPDKTRQIITTNKSPDVPFDRSINPYKGCEHGCVYCYARPTHAYLDLSPGLDFETKIFYKNGAVSRLREAFAKPTYICKPIAMGTNTDPYQPAEKKLEVTRELLKCFLEHKHPVSIVTKGSLILRDLDLLQELARLDLVSVALSITTLDNNLKAKLEPRTSSGVARLKVLKHLREVGITTGVLVAPIIPMLNDHEIETIIEKSMGGGAQFISYVLVRLPGEVAELFESWLQEHFPQKADRIMNRIREIHGGQTSSSEFGTRMRGSGMYAEMIRRRFETAKSKFSCINKEQPDSSNEIAKPVVNVDSNVVLRTDLFVRDTLEVPFF